MEMKYNSLKEALPSLLEEEKKLRDRISYLEVENNKRSQKDANFNVQLRALNKSIQVKDERLARAEEITARKYEEWNLYSKAGFHQLLSQYISEGFEPEEAEQMTEQTTELIRGKVIRCEKLQQMILKSLNSLLKTKNQLLQEQRTILEELEQTLLEANYMEVLYGFILLLIKATIDISSIVNMKLNAYEHLFGAALNDMLDTNSLAWIYKFSKNNEGILKENMRVLIEKVIKTNIPAYMYLIAVKFDNISDEDMIHLIAAIVASNDKKYIDYLLIFLSQKGVSEEVKEFIISQGISISAENMFNYDSTLADELEKALLEDDYETLYKNGMYSHDDRALVLANIQAGL